MAEHTLPRDDRGRFFSRRCPDLNCGGELQPDNGGVYRYRNHWRCDGLTHRGDCDPLEPCAYSHCDGDVRKAPR
jgi:hypothetical protein